MPEQEIEGFEDDRSRRRMFQEFEQAIRESNRTAIAAATGGISKEHFLRVAITVSRLRSRYLKEVLKLSAESGDRALDPTAILDLRQMREAYEEALHGFSALRHALERGYIELSGAKK